jgi:hypothetical protein
MIEKDKIKPGTVERSIERQPYRQRPQSGVYTIRPIGGEKGLQETRVFNLNEKRPHINEFIGLQSMDHSVK